MEVIKRIITKTNFRIYNIPESFGDKAEVIILPFVEEETDTDRHCELYYMMNAQMRNKSINMLNEPEEDVWNEL